MAWPQYEGIRQQSRLPSITSTQERLLPLELTTLLLAGFLAAAASIFVDLGTLKALVGIHMKTPGHAIVRAVFPMAFGFAAAPRRGAGCVMGGSALVSLTLLQWGGFGSIGLGATTSLFATGPCLDVAVHWMKRGRRMYIGLALAGLASNLIAFTVRGGIKYFGADHSHGRPLALWLPPAIFTYSLCGLAAGLFSAWVWFRFRDSET